MENKDLMRNAIEKCGEEAQLDMIVEKSLLMALSIQKFRKTNIKEDYLNYTTSYNDVCERIADMRIAIEQSEFLFNENEINEHYQNKIYDLKNSLT
jgi:hypothetical protein